VQYGLYSALVPVYAYALFGSSRQLAVGPVALISLLLNTGLHHILGAPQQTDAYIQQYQILAIQVSFLTGVLYIGMGLLRLGFVTIFLSHAVVSGFTTGAAVIIGTSQLKYIFGYKVPRSDVLHEILHNLFANIDEFNYKTFLMGTLSIVALLALKSIGKKYPKYKWVRAAGPLTVTALTVLFTWVFNLESKGIPIVGNIPRGLPSFTANLWTPIQQPGKVLTVTISIVLVGFMESIAIAKQLASKHKYELDSSLELIGLGMSNFMGAMFQSYPVTGSFSRSAVNNESGAQSGISGIVTASLVAMTLLFLTPVFEKLVRAIVVTM
jgi:sulfate transporter 4